MSWLDDYEFDVKKIKDRIEWTIWGISTIAILVLIGFAFYNIDWNMERLEVAFRLKFTQIYNVMLLWLPIILYDIITEDDTIKAISIPKTEIEKLATALFYGIMSISTALVIVWGR